MSTRQSIVSNIVLVGGASFTRPRSNRIRPSIRGVIWDLRSSRTRPSIGGINKQNRVTPPFFFFQ